MASPHWGLYEQLVTAALEGRLGSLDPGLSADRGKLDPEEAADRISLHLAGLLRRAIAGLDARQRTELGLRLAGQISDLLIDASRAVDVSDSLSPAGDVLRAIRGLRPDGSLEEVPSP